MNPISQYVANPKSRDAYTNSLATNKSIRTTSTRLRLSEYRHSEARYVLNNKKRISFQVDGIGFNMLYCPRGMFMMGSDNKDDKNPKRPIAIESPFFLGETEVTQELFEAVMGYNPSKFQGEEYPNSAQRPVECITWYDAVMFCNNLSLRLGMFPYYNIWVKKKENDYDTNQPYIGSADVTINPQANGFRLPYEKEWEYAAKAGTNNKYAGANDEEQLKKVAWFYENSTHPVKGKRPNEWGFYDMSGNVNEWCCDVAKELDEDINKDAYSNENTPDWDSNEDAYSNEYTPIAIRGGCYWSDPSNKEYCNDSPLRSSGRDANGITNYKDSIGVRVTLPLKKRHFYIEDIDLS